jgi:hypothetical protein
VAAGAAAGSRSVEIAIATQQGPSQTEEILATDFSVRVMTSRNNLVIGS